MRRVMFMLLCAASLAAAACAKQGGETAQAAGGVHKQAPGAVAEAPGKGMIPVIQGQKLAEYPDRTIGEAFGAYRHFDRKEWKEAKAEGGKFYVDYVGWYKEGRARTLAGAGAATVQGVEVKFVIYPDGGFGVAMVSEIALGADGTLAAYPHDDKKKVIDALYADREMKF